MKWHENIFIWIFIIWWLFIPIAAFLDTKLFFNPKTIHLVVITIPKEPTFYDVFWGYLQKNVFEGMLLTVGSITGIILWKKNWKNLKRLLLSFSSANYKK